jgi:hypothetical protein
MGTGVATFGFITFSLGGCLKSFGIVLLLLIFSACTAITNGSNAPGSADTASSSSSALVVSAPTLSVQQGAAINNLVSGSLANALFDLSGFGQSLMIGQNGMTTSFTVPCPQGGTLSITAAGTASISASFTQAQGGLTNVSATITLNACVNEGVRVDGSLSFSAPNNTGAINLNFMTGIDTFTAQGGAQVTGNLHVIAGSFNQACSFHSSDSVSTTGSIDANQSFRVTGSSTVQAGVQVCGLSFNSGGTYALQ